MSRPIFGRKSVNQLQRPRVDRFMPPRESFADERRRGSWRFGFHDETVNIWEAKHQKQKNYKNYLNEVFGLESIREAEIRGSGRDVCMQAWPCAPRKKGYLSSADSILDLPSYSHATFPEILDWSKNNMLVAALGYNYHMYCWKSQRVMGQGFTRFPIYCCKFNPKGDRLVTGSHMQAIELHDAMMTKTIYITTCQCHWEGSRICAISTVDWSPTGNAYVTGCSLGNVLSFDTTDPFCHSWKRVNHSPILKVKISPDARYVAAVAMNSTMVYVLKWPSLESHSILDSSSRIVKTIAWHPWRSALLGVGTTSSQPPTTMIAMWDTPSSRMRAVEIGWYNDYHLDIMLFSHVTGELVLSLWNPDITITFPKTGAKLVVMSDPRTVVDQSGEERNGLVLDRVRTMVFSPDGTKLATATAGEDLMIWNFLPEEKKNKYREPRRFYALPVYLDQCTNAFVLR